MPVEPEEIPAFITHEAWGEGVGEIVEATEIWLRILSDGELEIERERSFYKQKSFTPIVEPDDLPDVLYAMARDARARKEEEDKNPLEAFASRISRLGRTILRRSGETYVLSPSDGSGTVKITSWKEEPDSDGNIRVEVVNSVCTVGDENADTHLIPFLINMMSCLQYELNKAVKSEDPDYYAERFTQDVRLAILRMALREIEIDARNGIKKEEKEEVRVSGSCQARGEFYRPQVNYSLYCLKYDEGGRITIERTHIAQHLSKACFADAIKVPDPIPNNGNFGLGTIIKAINEISVVVEKWKKETEAEKGEETYRTMIREEIGKLKEALINDENVYGQVRVLKINPITSQYEYKFAQREIQWYEDADDLVLKTHTGNPQDPSCDELSALLELVI